MVDKPCKISLICWINDFTFGRFHQICTRRIAILLYSCLTFLTISRKNLTNILHDEIPSIYFLSCKESPSFPRCWFWINACIFVFLKLSILTHFTTITSIIIALSGHHSVQTSFTTIIRDVIKFVIRFLLWSGSTIAWFYFIAFGYFSFSFKVNILFDKCKEFETVSQIF